jgi:hypothetical protein
MPVTGINSTVMHEIYMFMQRVMLTFGSLLYKGNKDPNNCVFKFETVSI